MEVIALWLVLAVVLAVHAWRCGRSPAIWLLNGLLLSPVLAAALLFGFGPLQRRTFSSAGTATPERVLVDSSWAGALGLFSVLGVLQLMRQLGA